MGSQPSSASAQQITVQGQTTHMPAGYAVPLVYTHDGYRNAAEPSILRPESPGAAPDHPPPPVPLVQQRAATPKLTLQHAYKNVGNDDATGNKLAADAGSTILLGPASGTNLPSSGVEDSQNVYSVDEPSTV